jgi:hypothetical protein
MLLLHNLNEGLRRFVVYALDMILALHIVHGVLLVVLRAQRDGHQLLQNITTATTLGGHSGRLRGVDLVDWHEGNLRIHELCAVIADVFPCWKHRQGSGFVCSGGELVRYLKFGQLLRHVGGRLVLVLEHLYSFLNLLTEKIV